MHTVIEPIAVYNSEGYIKVSLYDNDAERMFTLQAIKATNNWDIYIESSRIVFYHCTVYGKLMGTFNEMMYSLHTSQVQWDYPVEFLHEYGGKLMPEILLQPKVTNYH